MKELVYKKSAEKKVKPNKNLKITLTIKELENKIKEALAEKDKEIKSVVKNIYEEYAKFILENFYNEETCNKINKFLNNIIKKHNLRNIK